MLLLLVAIGLTALSGVPGLFADRGSRFGQWSAALLNCAGCGLGLAIALGTAPLGPAAQSVTWPWPVPGGSFSVAIDPLSVLFLLPVFLISLVGSVYGLSYWRQGEHPHNARKLQLFYGLLTAGMALLVVARNAVLFLGAWEVMALSAFLLVATEDESADVREAARLYLFATRLATLSLFAMFSLMYAQTGSLDFPTRGLAGAAPSAAAAIFLLALVGFGLKAGVMPLHVWLPSSHAIAPTHVSAMMSGVIIKMGIYGLVRVLTFFPQPPVWWGGVLVALGVTSGVLGVAFAIGQHDLKRLLAYHSVENIGIIVLGLGLACLGRTFARPDWVLLGLCGALLHVWNHAIFKSLLFFSAGGVIHAAHTREIDALGGLLKPMPRTALFFLIGAVAICGLPPLNGFVSELLIYLGLFRTLGIGSGASWPAAAFAAPFLALMGALALACFVKVFGAVFLGAGRSEHVRHAHEAPPTMLLAMLPLAALCALIGLAPSWVAPWLVRAAAWGTAPTNKMVDQVAVLSNLAPLGWISFMGLLLLGLLAAGGVYLYARTRGRPTTVTWDCGYAAPSARMQYTSSSFAQMLVDLFGWALRPSAHRPQIRQLFPQTETFHSEVPDTVLDRAVLPAADASARFLARFRFLQQGSIQAYLLYVFAAVIVLMFLA